MERSSPAWLPEHDVVNAPAAGLWTPPRGSPPALVRPPARSPRAFLVALAAGIAVGIAASVMGSPLQRLPQQSAEPSSPLLPVMAQEQHGASLHCEGKRFCSQMRSCAEASFYASHCPETQLEEDERGVPCGVQLCWL